METLNNDEKQEGLRPGPTYGGPPTEEELPYDKEEYKRYFDEAKKRFPNLDDYLIHIGCVALLTDQEPDDIKSQELHKTYFKEDSYEGIQLCPIETQE